MMKHITGFFALLLGLSLLAGCAGQGQSYCPPAEEPDVSPTGGAGTPAVMTCRIVDGAEAGTLLLAANGGSAGEVYTLGVNQMNLEFAPENGQLINVYFETILETYPAQLSDVSAVELTGEPADDRCGLYLQVLEDLWEKDSGLNGAVQTIGVDLSGLTHLTESEKSAVAWRFGELHGVPVVEGTFEELAEAGYIDVVNGKAPAGVEHPIYEWTDGILFSITTDTEPGSALSGPGSVTVFDAQKWRSGTGAYFFSDCTALMMPDGSWTYTVSSEVIS